MWRKTHLLSEILSSLWQALQIQSTGSRLETGGQTHSLCSLWRSRYLVCRDCNFDDLGRVASQSYVADPCDHPTLVDLPRLGLCLQPGISETQKDNNRHLKASVSVPESLNLQFQINSNSSCGPLRDDLK